MKVLNAYKWVPFIYPEVHFTFPHPSCPSQATKKKIRFSVTRDGYKVIRELRDWLRELFQKKKRNLRY